MITGGPEGGRTPSRALSSGITNAYPQRRKRAKDAVWRLRDYAINWGRRWGELRQGPRSIGQRQPSPLRGL